VNEQLLAEIKLAYQTLNLVPIRKFFCLHEEGVDYACPIVCLAVHRGVTEKGDSDLAKDETANIALEWASRTFGEDFIWGLISAWEGLGKIKTDPDYLRGYDLGVEAALQLSPRDPAI
jgi:hypothetical protein